MPTVARPTLLRAVGPRAVEAHLLDAARAHQTAIRADPLLLREPVVLAVPSGSLRDHLLATLARELDATAGLRVETLHGLALSILRRAGRPAPRAAPLAAVLARRAARVQARWLGAGDDGVRAAAAAIDDLLDAGYGPESDAPLREALADAPLSGPERERAEALLCAAHATVDTLATSGVDRASRAWADAVRLLHEDPTLLRAREVWVHGFADATGLVADLLEALARARPLTLFWDDASSAPRFGAALRARFDVPLAGPLDELSGVEPIRARGRDAEVREVACRLRVLLDAGVVPESIGVVARDVGAYRLALRTHAARLSVPFSAGRARGPTEPAGRRWLALAGLLTDGERAPVERWRAARGAREPHELELCIALRALGAGRLGAAAALDLAARMGARDTLLLPLRVVRLEQEEHDGEDAPSEDGQDGESPEESEPPARREIPRRHLEAAAREAAGLARALAAWPAQARFGEHVAGLRGLAALLGWDAGAADDPVARDIGALAEAAPRDLVLARAEFLESLQEIVAEATCGPLGGRGGGVQILSVTEARGRTFEHLFVLGLNADAFPAPVREDPLLRDGVRLALRAVLPDLPLKRARAEEERALFESLVRASPRVTLSWLASDADAEPRAPSPFLDRAGIASPDDVEPCAGASEPRGGVAQPAHEHLWLAARDAGHAGFAALLPWALRRARPDLDDAALARLAAARRAILSELDRAPGPSEPLGPLLGFVGPRRAQGPRAQDLPVTTLEHLARCPWQAFLARALALRAAVDPLADLPDLEAAIVGEVAHAVLADLAPVQGKALAAVRDADGESVDWPTPAGLLTRARAAAKHVLLERGHLTHGLDRLVAARALVLLEAARAVDAALPGLRVSAAEVRGEIEWDGGRTITFRADRLEVGAGDLQLTDWKSGKVFKGGKKESTRTKHHRAGIAAGTHLQAMIYAQAVGTGRYVALAPRIADVEERVYPIQADDPEAAAALRGALDALFAAWDGGALFPRFFQGNLRTPNPACKHCEIDLACLRGDSGARLRLARFLRSPRAARAGSEEALARAVWSLQEKRVAPDASAGAQPEGA